MLSMGRKNPRYHPLSETERARTVGRDSVGAGLVATPWWSRPVIDSQPAPRPWIEHPLSRPESEMLLAAARGSLKIQAGRVSIDSRYASIVTVKALRFRGLITKVGAHITDSGREAIAWHRLG